MRNRVMSVVGLTCLLLSLGSLATAAQSGGPYAIKRYHVGSGSESSGGPYALVSSVGQADAGATMNGGDYTLVGGFQAAAATAREGGHKIYLPLLLRVAP